MLALGLALTWISFASREGNPRQPGDNRQTMDRTRLRPPPGMAEGVQTLRGVLVDAGCRNRDSFTLETTGERSLPPAAGSQGVARPADQIPEQVTENLVPDSASRQMDVGCAVTGATTAFAILLGNGQLKNLDEGGNTFAWEAVVATPEGQAVLEGRQSGVKRSAVLTGTLQGDRIMVESLRLEQGPPQTAPLRQP